jgi:hypothetical protein
MRGMVGVMPKFNIYERTHGGVDVETGKPIPARQPRRISIGWSRDRHAQLGVGWVDPDAEAKVPPHVGWSADFITSTELDEAQKVWQSQWIELDRHTINQLIRELRKARDEAFGRDE